MNTQLMKDAFLWGLILWIIGYALGFVLFMVVPPSLIGWVIMPVGILMTLWVLLKKVRATSFRDYVVIAVSWMLIAILCDYFFLVRLLNPVDGYYKMDVYLYYSITLILPILVGFKKTSDKSE